MLELWGRHTLVPLLLVTDTRLLSTLVPLLVTDTRLLSTLVPLLLVTADTRLLSMRGRSLLLDLCGGWLVFKGKLLMATEASTLHSMKRLVMGVSPYGGAQSTAA